jgi:CRP/FNR family transcriptional regulator, nitrogen oxide reductase regulator
MQTFEFNPKGAIMPTVEPRDRDLHYGLEWLEGLDRREIEIVLAAAIARRFPAKSIMTPQGGSADQFLLLRNGRARYYFGTPNGKKVILMWLTAGDIFGGPAILSRPCNYLVNTEAVSDCNVYVWERAAIRALAQRFPKLLENTLLTAMDYFSWYVAAHGALISQTAQERLGYALFGLAESIGEKVSGGVEISVTNEELANSANITPYTTSRIISDWQRSGAIRKLRGKILLRHPERFYLRMV